MISHWSVVHSDCTVRRGRPLPFSPVHSQAGCGSFVSLIRSFQLTCAPCPSFSVLYGFHKTIFWIDSPPDWHIRLSELTANVSEEEQRCSQCGRTPSSGRDCWIWTEWGGSSSFRSWEPGQVHRTFACPYWVREPGSFCPKEGSHKSSSSGQVSETCSSGSEVATPADNGVLVTSVSVQSFMSCYLITPFFRELVRILYPSIMIQCGIISPV